MPFNRMDKLYPMVRRVRRPLLPPDELVSREEAKGTGVPATALRAEEKENTSPPAPLHIGCGEGGSERSTEDSEP